MFVARCTHTSSCLASSLPQFIFQAGDTARAPITEEWNLSSGKRRALQPQTKHLPQRGYARRESRIQTSISVSAQKPTPRIHTTDLQNFSPRASPSSSGSSKRTRLIAILTRWQRTPSRHSSSSAVKLPNCLRQTAPNRADSEIFANSDTATCFFLGILFSSFPYDYNVLWKTPEDREFYFKILEDHIKFLHASPPIISRILHIAIGTGLLGFLMKLYKASEANMLFDGASLVLYMAGITVYVTNIVKGFRVVTAGIYGNVTPEQDKNAEDYITREDTLRVFAASNTILALVLVGVLVLQAGQWYALRKEEAELKEIEDKAEEKKKQGKKKQ